MKVIGLTGSFGTGKSYVASIFKRLGAKVIDADMLARKALKANSPSYKKVVLAFGEGILGGGRRINRPRLAEIVFGDKNKITWLNNAVHPHVIKDIKASLARARGKGVVVIDAPLLIEANLLGLVDKLVVVKSSEKVQVKRCIKKLGLQKADVIKRIRSQIPLAKKIGMADYVVDNEGTKIETKRQVLRIWKEIIYGDS